MIHPRQQLIQDGGLLPAARGILAYAEGSREFLDLNHLRSVLDDSLIALTDLSSEAAVPNVRFCRRCGRALFATTIVTADIDQAYEACTANSVSQALVFWIKRFRLKTGAQRIGV